MPPSTSPDKALDAILPLIKAGDAYSAHQKARTFASRYTKAKAYGTAIQVLFQSASELLKAGQPGSGTDLASMMIEVYETSDEKLSAESRGRLTQLIALTGTEGTWRDTLISKSLAWSAKASDCPAGDPDLHYYIGELLYKESNYPEAEYHLLSSGTHDAALLLAQLLHDWSRGAPDPAPFAARGVIPYLQVTNILAARTFLDKFMSLVLVDKPELLLLKEPVDVANDDSIRPTNNHTLNFLQMAVRICQRADPDSGTSKEAKNAWIRVCTRYAGGVTGSNPPGARMLLAGGDLMRQAIASLSELYFNIQPPRSGPANPLGDMMAALMGGGPPQGQGARRAIGRGRGRGNASAVSLD